MIDDLDRGTPGASARREYQRRHDNRERRLRERYGAVGVVLGRLRGDPQTTENWRRGADGEAQAARRLEKLLAGTGVVLLHDRRMPKSRANIDHLAIGPAGITVIDPKSYKGRVRVERRGGLFSARTEHLVVGGRDRTKLVEGMLRQVEAVQRAVGDGVSVSGALCWMQTGELPLLRRLEARGVAIAGPRRMARLAARPGSLGAAEIVALAVEIARRFPPA